jgi:DNA-3-methyladenine glycosylase
MLELMMGIAICMFGTRKVAVSTSDRLRIDECFGTNKTSSNVKPVSGLNFIFHLQGDGILTLLYNIPVPNNTQLHRSFFDRHTTTVARDLLGMTLVRMEGGKRVSGIITETEAYRGEDDLACHARAGRSPRTAVMYGKPGHAYVYFTYGMHWLLNFVTEAEGYPAAVLLRGIQPTQGLGIIAERRKGRPRAHWTDGPAKLCQALGIDGNFNGIDICTPETDLFIEAGKKIPDSGVTTGPRVGLNTVPEPWKSIPWRFRIVEIPIPDHSGNIKR